MSEKYSKADLRHIAEGMIEELRECEDGTVTTTGRLARAFGYEDMETFDLFDLHDALFRAARANHITLDMSEHKDKVEGLPFNLTFIVKNKKAQIKCPRCGSKNTARYIYGYPAFSEEMQQKLDAGKWVLGGCCISSIEINGHHVDTMPARKCNDCKKDFATAPILITPKNDTAEDYRDIVTCIKFSVGGYFDGYTDITIRKNDKGALVSVQKMLEPEEVPDDRQITPAKGRDNKQTIWPDTRKWKKASLSALDGTWSLDISLTGNRKRSYSGSNDYPPHWNELLKVFREFAKV